MHPEALKQGYQPWQHWKCRTLTPPSVKQAFCCCHQNCPVSCNVSIASGGDTGWNIAGRDYKIRVNITVIHNIQSKSRVWLSNASFLPCRQICQRWPDEGIFVYIFMSFIAVLQLDSGLRCEPVRVVSIPYNILLPLYSFSTLLLITTSCDQ